MPVENSEEKTLISTLQTQLNQIRERACSSNIQQEALSLIDQIVELESKLADEDDQDFESTAELDKDLEQCSKAIQQLQQTNLSFLSSISRTLTTNNSNSTHTLAILAEQHRKLKQDFNRLEHLDRRLINELDELRMQSNQLQEDIRKYNDVDSLKHQAERRKQQLMIDKLTMNQRRHITQMEIQTLQSQLDTLRTQLHANPTHQQVRYTSSDFDTSSSSPSRFINSKKNYKHSPESFHRKKLQPITNQSNTKYYLSSMLIING